MYDMDGAPCHGRWAIERSGHGSAWAIARSGEGRDENWGRRGMFVLNELIRGYLFSVRPSPDRAIAHALP
ncbi:MAG TPA: hypothetical protein VFV98_13815, partial [Vicinamibacterales bacterium]|nr:hypothetical protein [Vicinamibacterales bacterium]